MRAKEVSQTVIKRRNMLAKTGKTNEEYSTQTITKGSRPLMFFKIYKFSRKTPVSGSGFS